MVIVLDLVIARPIPCCHMLRGWSIQSIARSMRLPGAQGWAAGTTCALKAPCLVIGSLESLRFNLSFMNCASKLYDPAVGYLGFCVNLILELGDKRWKLWQLTWPPEWRASAILQGFPNTPDRTTWFWDHKKSDLLVVMMLFVLNERGNQAVSTNGLLCWPPQCWIKGIQSELPQWLPCRMCSNDCNARTKRTRVDLIVYNYIIFKPSELQCICCNNQCDHSYCADGWHKTIPRWNMTHNTNK